MGDRTCKNYMDDGGDKLVIGGTLEIEAGASVTGITTATIVDGLTSTDATKALSAKQGKALKDAADTLTTTVSGLTTTVGGKLTATVAANQAASVEATTPTVVEFNALLAKLKAAGLMTAD